MSEIDLALAFEELQRSHSALLHEHNKVKHLATTPQIDLKLAIFDRFPMPVWACDRECHIVFWNEGAARMYRWTSEEAIGRNFVDLFVNAPERDQARADCIDIIDNDRAIKNMADDIDRDGNTKTIITHCFALYNVGGHAGLQVEISYEVQDHDRLKEELANLQAAARRKQQEIEGLQQRLLEETRRRALAALEASSQSVRQAMRNRQIAADGVEMKGGHDTRAIEKVRGEIKARKDRLLVWERETRARILSNCTVDDLEAMIPEIENEAD